MENPILFIDLSYYIFYRFYALRNWYKRSQEDELDVENIMENELFINKYHKLFKENIKKIQKKHNIQNSLVIFGKDCRRYDIWRNEYYDEYKKNRDDKNRTFNPNIFIYTYEKIIPELEKDNIKTLCADNAEGDDIIAVLKKKYRDKYEELPIYIITNDHDYLQLFDNNTYIYNLQGLNLRTKSRGEEIDLKLKILQGDTSDNISSIFNKRISINKILEYVYDNEKLEKYLEENEDSKKLYQRNKLLIDFNMIPENIKYKINSLIEI
jgi:5'-3' exonuclease